MSYPPGVTDSDPHFTDETGYEDDEDDQEDWECAFPGQCLMPDPLHHRSECHTVEDAEAYYTEVEGI